MVGGGLATSIFQLRCTEVDGIGEETDGRLDVVQHKNNRKEAYREAMKTVIYLRLAERTWGVFRKLTF